jgi:hypothetical protein
MVVVEHWTIFLSNGYGEQLNQSLSYKTPDRVYQTAIGGGAKIIDIQTRKVA